jgi:hypothetical protein
MYVPDLATDRYFGEAQLKQTYESFSGGISFHPSSEIKREQIALLRPSKGAPAEICQNTVDCEFVTRLPEPRATS